MIVEADTETGAHRAALSNERESVGDYDSDIANVQRLDKLSDVPDDWRDCFPYDGDGNTRIKQYFLD